MSAWCKDFESGHNIVSSGEVCFKENIFIYDGGFFLHLRMSDGDRLQCPAFSFTQTQACLQHKSMQSDLSFSQDVKTSESSGK